MNGPPCHPHDVGVGSPRHEVLTRWPRTGYQGDCRGAVGFPSGSGPPTTFAKGLSILFELTTDTPAPYEAYWKVRNTGEEARVLGQLRGQILEDEGRQQRREHTKYTGNHDVDVYVVKERRVVATDRVSGRIR